MIEDYLRQIDELLSVSPAVRAVEVLRRTQRDTEWEKVLHYRAVTGVEVLQHILTVVDK